MSEIFVPVRSSFENGNRFSGSCGPMRFMLTPNIVMSETKEINLSESLIRAQVWHGQLCLEKSTVEVEKDFPMDEEDVVNTIRLWLEEQSTAYNE